MANTKIYLEDNGQDFLSFTCNEDGVIINAEPYQSSIWEGGVIPIQVPGMVEVGEFCPMHHPPAIEFGFLRERVKKIEIID